jgi:hypothetical protein
MRLDLRCFSLLAALAAGCTTLPLDQGGNQNGEDMKGSDPCQAAAGYCDPGDLVQPTCKTGYHEGTSVEQAHPGVCGLGICCVPDCAGYPDAQ